MNHEAPHYDEHPERSKNEWQTLMNNGVVDTDFKPTQEYLASEQGQREVEAQDKARNQIAMVNRLIANAEEQAENGRWTNAEFERLKKKYEAKKEAYQKQADEQSEAAMQDFSDTFLDRNSVGAPEEEWVETPKRIYSREEAIAEHEKEVAAALEHEKEIISAEEKEKSAQLEHEKAIANLAEAAAEQGEDNQEQLAAAIANLATAAEETEPQSEELTKLEAKLDELRPALAELYAKNRRVIIRTGSKEFNQARDDYGQVLDQYLKLKAQIAQESGKNKDDINAQFLEDYLDQASKLEEATIERIDEGSSYRRFVNKVINNKRLKAVLIAAGATLTVATAGTLGVGAALGAAALSGAAPIGGAITGAVGGALTGAFMSQSDSKNSAVRSLSDRETITQALENIDITDQDSNTANVASWILDQYGKSAQTDRDNNSEKMKTSGGLGALSGILTGGLATGGLHTALALATSGLTGGALGTVSRDESDAVSPVETRSINTSNSSSTFHDIVPPVEMEPNSRTTPTTSETPSESTEPAPISTPEPAVEPTQPETPPTQSETLPSAQEQSQQPIESSPEQSPYNLEQRFHNFIDQNIGGLVGEEGVNIISMRRKSGEDADADTSRIQAWWDNLSPANRDAVRNFALGSAREFAIQNEDQGLGSALIYFLEQQGEQVNQ